MNGKYKPQNPWRDGFFFSFLQTSKKGSLWWNAFAWLGTFKLSEKVNCQNINEVHEILHLFTKDLKIKAERESVKLNIVIEFSGDGQYKSQHFLSLENARVQKLVVCLGTPLSKTLHHITSEINWLVFVWCELLLKGIFEQLLKAIF